MSIPVFYSYEKERIRLPKKYYLVGLIQVSNYLVNLEWYENLK